MLLTVKKRVLISHNNWNIDTNKLAEHGLVYMWHDLFPGWKKSFYQNTLETYGDFDNFSIYIICNS